MTGLMRFAVSLYPARWRARYGGEFEALIEDLDPGWLGFWNIVHGGLVMQLRSIGAIPVCLALAGVLLGGVVAARTRDLYRSSATVTLRASDPQRVRAMLGKTFGPGSHPGVGLEKAAWIRVAIDERGPAPKDGATRLVVASEDEDAARAQRVTRQLVDLVARTAAAQAALQFDTISAPNLPTSPSGPSRAGLALSCAAAGVLLGALVAWFRRRSFDQSTPA